MDVVRLRPYQYIHVLDNNSSVTRLLVGPLTYTKLDQERVVHSAPQPMVCVPQGSYCVVESPVVRDAEGRVVFNPAGQAMVRVSDVEIRFAQEPFPLYPSEKLATPVTKMTVLGALQGLRVQALRDYTEADGKVRQAGDEWLVRGPCTYVPRVESQPISEVKAVTIGFNEALQLRAVNRFTDADGVPRIPGEEWLVERVGAYMPSIDEEVVGIVKACVLTPTRAIHVRALRDYVDRRGVARVSGQEWLVTNKDTEAYIPQPCEKVFAVLNVTVLNSRQYAVVDNYIKDNIQHFGLQELRKGPATFFLHPGEQLSGNKIFDVVVLAADEALLLFAKQAHSDGTERRAAGTRWMLYGPAEYIPPAEVEIIERRRAIPLDATEGVYIRNIRTGVIRAHVGTTVMLTEDEELWEKLLPPLVEELLCQPRLTRVVNDRPATRTVARQKHKVVTCNVPHSSVCQVYNFSSGVARVILGPSLVMLMPDEEFTVLSLSGGKPKKAGSIKTLALFLGPDFMTDLITVETSDHARLELHMSYNWEFRHTAGTVSKVFSVRDFIGDACKAIASRIRGFIASEPFDSFHRNSSQLIRFAVFGKNKETQTIRSELSFPSSGLVITNIDIHSVDPVDPKTREALTKSVQLAIEITTKSQEAAAQQQAMSLEQEAKGKLQRQIILDKAETESHRKSLLEIDSHNAAVESTGASKAHAKAMAEAKQIEGQSEVDLATKRAEAASIMARCELEVDLQKKECELSYLEAVADLELEKTKELSIIEAEKFEKVIAAVGKETIKAIARSGPEMQVRLLKALGLQGYLVTDGSNPINLFNTAKGLAQSAAAGIN